MGRIAFAIGSILGGFGDVAFESRERLQRHYASWTREAEEQGCYAMGENAE